ncbi:50S ribosomal protein L25/general stress protein Ctc [Ornithinimicrobium sediminis]|uniref:50S ribosomal protein L25/general stress protein Ctc n=1 Tax=Ornithinimicrobium sediminis TaxID=2904603 RepID=UPI001E61BBA6|nr:50S ribosomal protein L25/general stress protein Ctc [Ornithinimicrobium sediminis]MCE0485653.1 50S ribosomal protein L25/general stress protein Ctc [Ornithinimicrobium sediminis]
MSDQIRISAEKRTQFGKGAARRIRRADKVPAVLYGHGNDPLHLTLPGHDTMMAMKLSNAVLTLDVDGEEHLALAKDVQRDPIKRFIEHVDLVTVIKGEKVEVDVYVHVEGEAAPETLVNLDHSELTIEAEATRIPESITVSVEGLEAGTQIHAGELTLPDGVTLVTDPDALVVNVTQAKSEEALESELAEVEAELGIEKDESEESAEGETSEESAEGETSEAEQS